MLAGEGALLNDLVDFIIAAQIARKPESDIDDTIPGDEGKNEVLINGTMTIFYIYYIYGVAWSARVSGQPCFSLIKLGNIYHMLLHMLIRWH